MKTTLTLNAAQKAAVNRRNQLYNEAAGTDLTAGQYLTRMVLAQVDVWVAEDEAAAAREIAQRVRSLPSADRAEVLAVIQDKEEAR
jgi:hypothetical protein